MNVLPRNHRQARAFLWVGLGVIVAAMAANVLLGGTGGLVWIALVVLGFLAAVVGLAWLLWHPVRRGA